MSFNVKAMDRDINRGTNLDYYSDVKFHILERGVIKQVEVSWTNCKLLKIV